MKESVQYLYFFANMTEPKPHPIIQDHYNLPFDIFELNKAY